MLLKLQPTKTKLGKFGREVKPLQGIAEPLSAQAEHFARGVLKHLKTISSNKVRPRMTSCKLHSAGGTINWLVPLTLT